MSAAPPPFHWIVGAARPRGNTVLSYGYSSESVGSAADAVPNLPLTVGSTGCGSFVRWSFTVALVVAVKVPYLAVTVPLTPRKPVAVSEPGDASIVAASGRSNDHAAFTVMVLPSVRWPT